MSDERPPITGTGRITEILESGRLYKVTMPNGYVAYAVIPKDGPPQPKNEMESTVEVAFSPYDMSRCKITAWK